MAPVLFRIGTAVVDTYTVIWALALALALAWTRRRAGRLYRLDDEDARVALFWGFLGILAGARIGNILVDWQAYAENPERLLRPWEGGLSALPAILGGGVTAWLVLRKRRVPAWPLAEAASLPAAALVAFGRWGCFLNGCCYGRTAFVPWSVHFPFDPEGVFRHPTELYESAGAVVLLFLLAWIERGLRKAGRKRPPVAILWPLFLAGYGAVRLVVDRFRGDVSFNSPLGWFWSLAVFLLGAAWLFASLSGLARERGGGKGERG